MKLSSPTFAKNGAASPQTNVVVDAGVPEFYILDRGVKVKETLFQVIEEDVGEKARDRRAHRKPKGLPAESTIKQLII